MKISVNCTGSAAVALTVEVQALGFDASSQSFSMPCPRGDDWLQRLNCPLQFKPAAINFLYGGATIVFGSAAEAEAFADWLSQAECEAQHGYATMRG